MLTVFLLQFAIGFGPWPNSVSFLVKTYECTNFLRNTHYSVFRGRNGSTAKYDEKTIKACAKKVLKLNKTLNIEPDELSIEYISQFSYEICKNGYYEGKGSDNRGKKYYPEAD